MGALVGAGAQFLLGEAADGVLKLLLFRGECEIHVQSPNFRNL
jgi:hypothetical protein